MAVLSATHVETPGRHGPFRRTSDGALYYIAEKDPTPNHRPYVWKSANDGVDWAVVDDAGTPTGADLEGFDIHRVGDLLYCYHHRDTIKYRHLFNMATDTWSAIDEIIETGAAGTCLVQNIAGARRSDGTEVAFWVSHATPNQIVYRIRSTGGVWSAATIIAEGSACTGVMGILDEDDVFHLIYFRHGDTNIIYRTLSAADSLSGATDIGDSFVDTGVHCPTLPCVKYGTGASETIVLSWINGSFHIMYSEVVNGGAPTAAAQFTEQPVVTEVQPANDSDQPTASMVAYANGDLCLLYADRNARKQIWSRHRRGGTLMPSVHVLTTTHTDLNGGPQWLRAEANSDGAIDFMYDDFSGGAVAQIYYGEIPAEPQGYWQLEETADQWQLEESTDLWVLEGGLAAGGPPAGSGASTLSFASSGTGQELMQGSGASTLSFSSSGTAVEEMRASGSSTLSFASSGTGTHTPSAPGMSGSGASTLSFASSGTGVEAMHAFGASTLSFASSGTAALEVRASGASTLSFASSGTGNHTAAGVHSGSGSSTLSYASSGTGEHTGTGAPPPDTHDGADAPKRQKRQRGATRKRPLPLPTARRQVSTEENAAAMARHPELVRPSDPVPEAASASGRNDNETVTPRPESTGSPAGVPVKARAINAPIERAPLPDRLVLEPLTFAGRDRAAAERLIAEVAAREAQAEAARRMAWLLREDEEILALLDASPF